jgi:hypothetical protein
MRRYIVRTVFLALSVFVSAAPAFAEDDQTSFVVAPAPVGYPEFERGDRIAQAGGNVVYASLDYGDDTLRLYGAMGFGSYQYSPTDSLALGASFGGSMLAGSDYEMLVFQLPLNASVVYEALKSRSWSLFLFGGGGAALGLTNMTIPVMHLVTITLVEDPTTLTTTTVTGSFNVGVQANISAGTLVVSPFGTYTYSAGSYNTTQTSAMSFEYPSTSGSVDGYATTVFGFDVLHRPSGITLSSQLRSSPKSTLVSVAVKWLLKGFRRKAGV